MKSKKKETLTIHLDETYFLDADDMQYTLKKYTGGINKDGDKVYKVIGYYGDIDQAIAKVARLKVLSSHDSLIIDEYLSELKNELKTLRKVLKYENI